MFKHIVLWKFNDSANGKNRQENLHICADGLRQLKGIIPEIKTLEVGMDELHTPASYDMVLISEFDSPESFYVYRDHPEHVAVAKYLSSCVTDRVSIDYSL